MNKRQRKKCHVGEFTEWGVQFVVTLKSEEALDIFLDAFLDDALKTNDCSCTGEVYDDKLNVVVELGSRVEEHVAKLQAVTSWLDGRDDVQGYKTGEIFDIWYDDYEDIDEAAA